MASSGFPIAVLVSGTGTNLQALIDRFSAENSVEIACVVSDNPEAMALQRAAAAGIPTGVFPLADFPDRESRDIAMAEWVAAFSVELVVLAGYMRLLTTGFLDRFKQRVINVHPSLLPAFPGIDALGQALAYGVKVVGVTVHYVDQGVDTGQIIAQRAVQLPEGELTADQLAELVRPLEHSLLPEVVVSLARTKDFSVNG